MQIIQAKDMHQIKNLKQDWEGLLSENAKEENLDDLFRSYEWIDHLSSHKKNENVYLLVQKSKNDKIIGLVPFTLSEYSLNFDMKSHILRHKSLQVNWILGNDLLLPDDAKGYDDFFKKMLTEYPDSRGIYFESVKENSFLGHYLNTSKNLRKQYFSYLPEGKRNYFYLKLPETYEAYWDSHQSCHKKDTMKKNKKIGDHFGSLELRCYQAEESVNEFLETATAIGKKSWQYEVIGPRIKNDQTTNENMKDLARRKIFHSYILYGGDQPLACSCGFSYNDTWIGDEIAFDKDFARFSPGWVMICSIIENLIERKYQYINMGVGEGAHKERVCNRKTTDFSLLLLKKTISNYIIIKDHTGFLLTKRYLKKISDKSQKK